MAKATDNKSTDARKVEKPPAESIKETIDSIIIALALALVFRAFFVEAFVIPTGSMATTLLGDHYEIVCRDCGKTFYVDGVRRSDEQPELRRRGAAEPEKQYYCPSCEQLNGRSSGKGNPPNGDKILVFKFPYLFDEPQRWDVVVFYNPALPSENFIKRLIGRPGEYLQIRDGDIYIGTQPDKLQIQRKPPVVQQTLWLPVYLNDYWPGRQGRPGVGDAVPAWKPETSASGWNRQERQANSREPQRRFVYQPSLPDGEADQLTFHPGGRIGFSDYVSYNGPPITPEMLSIVQDLRLDFVLWFAQPGGTLSASMNRGQTRFVAHFHQDGQVELVKQQDGQETQIGQAKLDAFPTGSGVEVALQNVDFRASVFVDGEEVLATTDEQYHPSGEENLGEPDSPVVWLRAYGQPLEVRHLSLWRDVYYTARQVSEHGMIRPVDRGTPQSPEPVVDLKDFEDDRYDEFFMLGDNSAASSDSRLWRDLTLAWHLRDRDSYRLGRVPRDHLIGRAFFVYWPAGLRLFGTELHLVPSVGRMRLIH